MITATPNSRTSHNKYFKGGKQTQLLPLPVRKNNKVVGMKWTKVNLVDVLSMLPDYSPFVNSEDFYFDINEYEKFTNFVVNECVYPEGELAGLPFIPELWQWSVFLNIFCWKDKKTDRRRYREVFVLVPRKNGKELSLDTKLPTPTGSTTMGEVTVGQILFDKDGRQCQVTHVHPIDLKQVAYDVVFSNGETVKACADHNWYVHSRVQHPKYNNIKGCSNLQLRVTNKVKGQKDCYKDVWTTQEMFDRGVDCWAGKTFCVPMHNGIECSETKLEVDPYLLGYWLGDGSKESGNFTVGDEDLAEFLSNLPDTFEYTVTRHVRKTGTNNTVVIKKTGRIPWRKQLDRLNLLSNKHIPNEYLRTSVKQRLELLQGLMDSDGTISKKGTDLSFCNKNKTIIDGVAELLASLGLKYSLRTVYKSSQNGTEGKYYQLQFVAFKDTHPVFKLQRKLNRQKQTAKTGRSRNCHIISITPCNSVPMRCITVNSPSGTYLFGNTMLPTHNTSAFGVIPTLYMTYCDVEQRSQNFCCAADIEQASVNFRHVSYNIEKNPNLLNRLVNKRVNRSVRSFETKNGNTFKVLSSIADTKHGLSPNFVYIDEVHAHKDGELIDVMVTGTAARPQPLIIYTTTADFDRISICNDLYARAKKIALGHLTDNNFLPVLYEADITDDFRDEEIWRKANPNFGISIYPEYFKRQIQVCDSSPKNLNRFLRLHLNIRTKTETVWIPPWVWANGNASTDNLLSVDDIKSKLYEFRYWHTIAQTPEFNRKTVDVYISEFRVWYTWYLNKLEELRDSPCWGGYDNSSASDIASFVLYFPNERCILPWFWVPAESIDRRSKEDRVPYDRWYKAGLINNTPMARISETDISNTLVGTDNGGFGICSYFTAINNVAFDRWGSNYIYEILYNYGIQAQAYPQTFAGMNEPCNKLETMIVNKELFHGSNPVLDWMNNNTMAVCNNNNQMRVDKNKSTDKVDGMVATLMAIGGQIHTDSNIINSIPGLVG